MNSYFTIILYVVEGSEKMLTFCIVVIFREKFRMERLRKDVFIFNLTGVYMCIDSAYAGNSTCTTACAETIHYFAYTI